MIITVGPREVHVNEWNYLQPNQIIGRCGIYASESSCSWSKLRAISRNVLYTNKTGCLHSNLIITIGPKGVHAIESDRLQPKLIILIVHKGLHSIYIFSKVLLNSLRMYFLAKFG